MKRNILQNYKLVGVDPGKGDLGYFIDENSKRMKYSNGRKQFESKSTRNKEIRKKMRENTFFTVVNEKNKDVTLNKIEIENYLTRVNTRTLSSQNFKTYI